MDITRMEVNTKKKGLTGSTLKIIAIISMLIDHTTAVLLGRILVKRGMMDVLMGTDPNELLNWLGDNWVAFAIYWVLRFVGRIAFPIFVFLMVEGFLRTRNKWKYLARLTAFALISEIPFDLALRNNILDFEGQNVFFTLAIGLLTMIICEALEKKLWTGKNAVFKVITVVLTAIVIVAGGLAADMLLTDYGFIGIICIMAIYLFRKNKTMQLVAGCVAFLWEVTAPLAFVPIAFYNGERGMKLKYMFYAFYPVHLLILYGIAVLCGLGAYISV